MLVVQVLSFATVNSNNSRVSVQAKIALKLNHNYLDYDLFGSDRVECACLSGANYKIITCRRSVIK